MRGVFSQRGFWKLAFWLLWCKERGTVGVCSPHMPCAESKQTLCPPPSAQYPSILTSVGVTTLYAAH